MSRLAGGSWEFTERHILHTSAALFARHGYWRLSARQIASAAGFSEITIYRHFARKRDLFLAALGAELELVYASDEELLKSLGAASNGRAALCCVLDRVRRLLCCRPDLLRLLHFCALELTDDLQPVLQRHLGEFVRVMADYLQPWTEKGELRRSEPSTLVLSVIAIAIAQVPLARIFMNEPANSELLTETFMDLCAFDFH